MLKDDEIELRALEPEDLDWLYSIENDTGLWQWGSANVPYSRFALKTYIAESRSDIYADGQLRLVVVSSRSGEVLGCVDLMNLDARHLRAEVGIVIFPRFGHMGYGMRVLDLLTDYCRSHIYLHTLYAVIAENNSVACGLFEKAGFARMANLKDWLRAPNGRFISAIMYGLTL